MPTLKELALFEAFQILGLFIVLAFTQGILYAVELEEK